MSPHIISVHLLCAFIYNSVDVLKNNELNIVLFKVGCNKMIFDQKYSGLSRKKKKDFSKNGTVVEIKEKNSKMKNSKNSKGHE